MQSGREVAGGRGRQVKREWLHVAATPTECSQIDQY